MKLFLKIIAGFLILLIIVLIGLNLYFTDERLKTMILPELREMTGSDIQVEHMSLTFFKTFPQAGVELTGFALPDPEGNPVATLEELVVGVELLPLLSNEISISELVLDKPVLNYLIYEDSTTNIDFLLTTEAEDTTEEDSGYEISIPEFTIHSATVSYSDITSQMSVDVRNLDAEISLQFAELIESTLDAQIGSLSVMMDSIKYLDGMAIAINQSSTLDIENEELNLTEGILSIRGLALNINGLISAWSGEAPKLNLEFSSASENFGELLRLAPSEYDELLEGLETRGSLQLEGSVTGNISENSLPQFSLILNVENGYLKNPDLPEAIEDIVINAEAGNELITLNSLSANAAGNKIQVSGSIQQPLEDNAAFNIDFEGDVDLSSIAGFYPLDEAGIQSLKGMLVADISANGKAAEPENAKFTGNFILNDGALQFSDVSQAIENIEAQIRANETRIDIENIAFEAAENTFSMEGNVLNPLAENNRTVDLNAELNFDLATIKNFYPLDEDTLMLRGKLNALVNLSGKVDMDNPGQLLQQGRFTLTNGFVRHVEIAKPLEDITLRAEASGSRLQITEARFDTGENSLALNGTVTNYLSENPNFDLFIEGDAVLADVTDYYSLEPWIQQLTGTAELNLRATGPAGNPQQIKLNGDLILNNVEAKGDSLPLPVSQMNGTFSVNPQSANLQNFSMKFGSSDISLEGEMRNYMGMLAEQPTPSERPKISGRYESRLLNLDEMIDWDAEEETSEEPIYIELPQLDATVEAAIEKLVIFGLEITRISGTGTVNPQQVQLNNAQAHLFDGTATGNFTWNVPQPDQTAITFNGSLDEITAEAFFRDTGFLGKNSNIHQYLNGALSAEIQYNTTLNELMEPVLPTTKAEGRFGMTRARLAHHPVQEQIASLLKIDELSTLALDSWEANFTMANETMTFRDFKITSENIGFELGGTYHLTAENINFDATVLLPERFKKGIASILPNRAADALQRDDGTIAVPLKITGTMSKPQVRQDNDLIKQIVQDYLKDQGGKLLDRLFDN